MFFALRGLAKGICQERACRILPQKVRVTDEELKRLPNSCFYLFLGVKSSMTCPSWRKCGSAGMMRQLRLTRKAWSWHHRTQIQKRIEKDRNRVQGLLFSQNFSFWMLRQDSSLKEGLQKANSVLVKNLWATECLCQCPNILCGLHTFLCKSTQTQSWEFCFFDMNMPQPYLQQTLHPKPYDVPCWLVVRLVGNGCEIRCPVGCQSILNIFPLQRWLEG